MIKVALIQCYGSMQPPNTEPLAVETLAGALKQKFRDQIIVDLFLLDERNDPYGAVLAKQLANESDIAIVGLSIPQSTYYLALNFLHHLKENKFFPLIVLGHAIPTHSPEAFLDRFSEALIVRGWGEIAICEIVEQYLTGQPDWSKVHSLVFQKNEQTKRTPIKWPRDLPSPLRLSVQDYFTRVESSRGCHYDVCTFCTRQPKEEVKTVSWFRLPVDQVLNEIARLRSMGMTKFTFADEDFVGKDLTGAEKIAQGIKDIGGMQFSLSLRVDNVYDPKESDAETSRRLNLFRLLKEAGLSLVYFGVESLADTQLRRYGKGVRARDSVQAIEAIEAIGIPMELGYILFDPLLTVDELQENERWLTTRSFTKYIGQLFNNLRVQSDSAFARRLERLGLLSSFNPNTIEYSYEYQNQDIGKVAAICLKWKDEIDEVYALARNVQRTEFNGSSCERFVRKFRLLELDMLRQLMKSLNNPGEPHLDSIFLDRRLQLINELKQGILSFKTYSSAIEVLSLAIDRFIEREDGMKQRY